MFSLSDLQKEVIKLFTGCKSKNNKNNIIPGSLFLPRELRLFCDFDLFYSIGKSYNIFGLKKSHTGFPQEVISQLELIDITGCSDFVRREEHIKNKIFVSKISLAESAIITQVLFDPHSKNCLGFYVSSKSKIRSGDFLQQGGFNGISSILLKSRKRLKNIRLGFLEYILCENYKEYKKEGEFQYKFFYEKQLENEEEKEYLKFPEFFPNNVHQINLRIFFDSEGEKEEGEGQKDVEIEFINLTLNFPSLNKIFGHAKFIMRKANFDFLLYSYMQYFQIRKNTAIGPLYNIDISRAIENFETTEGVFLKEKNTSRKSAFLMGVIRKNNSPLHRSFNSELSDFQVLKLLFSFIPDYEIEDKNEAEESEK